MGSGNAFADVWEDSVELQGVSPEAFQLGDPLDIRILADGSEGEQVFFAAFGLPDGVEINPVTGNISGIPVRAGDFPVTAFATKIDSGQFARIHFGIEVIDSGDRDTDINGIIIDGDLSEWRDLATTITDPIDIPSSDSSHSIDLLEFRLFHDSRYLYLGMVNQTEVNLHWGYMTYLDVDTDLTTGYKFKGSGFDFLILGDQLMRYTGDGFSWEWDKIHQMDSASLGNHLELRLPHHLIGSPESMYVLFHGDNASSGFGHVDLVPDGGHRSSHRYLYSIGSKDIRIDGDFREWLDIPVFASDPEDVTDRNGVVDWKNIRLVKSGNQILFAYAAWRPFEPSWSENIYLDSDMDSGSGFRTGETGAEYLWQNGILYEYTGNGESWSWERTSQDGISWARSAYRVEVSIPAAHLDNPSMLRLQLVAKNEAIASDSQYDYFPDDSRGLLFRMDGGTGNLPPAVPSRELKVRANERRFIPFLGSDAEGGDLTYRVISAPEHGILSVESEGAVYQPFQGYSGNDSFSIVANDGEDDSRPALFTLDVARDATQSFSPGDEISIDGALRDWDNRVPTQYDSAELGRKSIPELDWRQVFMAHDKDYLYAALHNNSPIQKSWGIGCMIDLDDSSTTGFFIGDIGADILVQGDFIFKYIGENREWKWLFVGTVDNAVSKSGMEIRIKSQYLENGGTPIKLRWLGDNVAYRQGGYLDMVPDLELPPITFDFNSALTGAQNISRSASDGPVDLRSDIGGVVEIIFDIPYVGRSGLAVSTSITLPFSAQPGDAISLERSSNLKSWFSFHQASANDNRILIIDPLVGSGQNAGFFRVQSHAPDNVRQ